MFPEHPVPPPTQPPPPTLLPPIPVPADAPAAPVVAMERPVSGGASSSTSSPSTSS
jgi:hypothetical protein